MRKRAAVKRDVLADPMYNSKLVTKLINTIMKDGKKGTAQRILYDAFDLIKEKTNREPMEVTEAAEGKLVVGVPLHSDYYKDHDIIAGAKNAYYETITGLFNLASYGAGIELRIVINKLNYMRLPQLAEFIQKNLPFVEWTAFMGMEYIGYAVKNKQNIWIEPVEYISHLIEAIKIMAQWHLDVSIYNIPLCLLPKEAHEFARQSVSNWKVKYLPICEDCKLKSQCCGLFSTSQQVYNGLKPMNNEFRECR